MSNTLERTEQRQQIKVDNTATAALNRFIDVTMAKAKFPSLGTMPPPSPHTTEANLRHRNNGSVAYWDCKTCGNRVVQVSLLRGTQPEYFSVPDCPATPGSRTSELPVPKQSMVQVVCVPPLYLGGRARPQSNAGSRAQSAPTTGFTTRDDSERSWDHVEPMDETSKVDYLAGQVENLGMMLQNLMGQMNQLAPMLTNLASASTTPMVPQQMAPMTPMPAAAMTPPITTTAPVTPPPPCKDDSDEEKIP